LDRGTARLEMRAWTLRERNRKAGVERLDSSRKEQEGWRRETGLFEKGTGRLEKRDWTLRERNRKAGMEKYYSVEVQ
jgi:hypothetical protein